MIQLENLSKEHILDLMVKIFKTINEDKCSFGVTEDEIMIIYTSVISTLQFCYINEANSESERNAVKLKISNESKPIGLLFDEIIENARKENAKTVNS